MKYILLILAIPTVLITGYKITKKLCEWIDKM